MEDTSTVVSVGLPLIVAVIMFSLGLALTPADFKRVLVVPKGVAIGLVNLLVISPLLAFGVAAGFDLAPTLAVGLVLLGASPGGAMANLLTHLARGDVALSVTMTAVSSVAAVVTIPLFLGIAADVFDARDVSDQINTLGVSARVFAITVVPVSLAMWLRHRNPDRIAVLEPRFKRAALVAFVLVVGAAVVSEWDRITEHFAEVALAALALNVLAMSVSFTVARAAQLHPRQATAIAMELGVHNSTVAISIATGVATALAVPAAVYSAFMFLTAGLFARLMARRNARALADGS
jgi:BASS family bile acid:Na+ symporter